MPSMEEIGAIRQQVSGLEKGYTEIRDDMKNVRSEMSTGFSNILARIDSKTTPQWQPIGILVSVLLAIGGALYLPIRENASKQEALTEMIRGQLVPRVEHERLWRDQQARDNAFEERIRSTWSEQNKVARELSYLQGQMHPLPKQ